jgi:hypothetical protein
VAATALCHPEQRRHNGDEFHIETVAPGGDGDPVVTASALDGNRKVTFQLVLGREWTLLPSATTVAAGNQLAMGSAKIKSVGDATEMLVRAYAKAAKVKVKTYEFSEARFPVISMGPNPGKMMKEVIGLKLHQGARGGGDYLELFVQMDVLNRSLVVEETNVHSRASIVRLLTSKLAEKKE